MAVRDQELGVLEARGVLDTPELVPAALKIGLAARPLERITLVEQKDRLELRAGGAEQPEPALLRARMRALVREDDSALVGLGTKRGDQPRPRAVDAVRADVILGEEPVAGLRVAREHALVAPSGHITAGLLLVVGKGQVDDVVRAAREVVLALRGRDHVIGRRHEPLQRACLRLVVALGAKRLDFGHLGRP